MKAISLDNLKSFIWAPKALIGSELTPQESLLIEIDDNIIVSIEYILKDEIPAEISGKTNFFCLEDDITLLPCLIDAHVHLAINYGDDNADDFSLLDNEEDLLKRIQEDLDCFLSQGILGVRDGGDSRAVNLKIRDLISNKSLCGPEVIATGEALRKHGSYGSFLGNGYSLERDLPEIIDRLLASGINQLKVLVSGIVSFREYGKVDLSSITRDELQYIVARAHGKGVKVMAHASSDVAVDMSVEVGVDSIEHGYFLNKESLERIADREVTWVPTIIPVAIQIREPLVYDRSQKEIDVITRTYEKHMESLIYARKIGVPLGIGTDSGASGVKHGISLMEEMLLYSKAGLSNKDVLHSAMIVNAKTVGLEENMGCIQINKKPCLIGVQGDPTIDLNDLKRVEWIFRSTAYPDPLS